MAGKSETGLDTQDREEQASVRTNPTGKSADAQAEGGDDTSPKQPGSPEG